MDARTSSGTTTGTQCRPDKTPALGLPHALTGIVILLARLIERDGPLVS